MKKYIYKVPTYRLFKIYFIVVFNIYHTQMPIYKFNLTLQQQDGFELRFKFSNELNI